MGPPTSVRKDEITDGRTGRKTVLSPAVLGSPGPSTAGTTETRTRTGPSSVRKDETTDGRTEHKTGLASSVAETAETRIRTQLQLIRECLVKMEEKVRVQRNISTVITTNMARIREATDEAWHECDRMHVLGAAGGKNDVDGETTPQTKRKRETTGSSPELTPAKRPSEGTELTPWQTVARKQKRKTTDAQKRRTTETPSAATTTTTTTTKMGKGGPTTRRPGVGVVLIKPTDGKTYADTLRRMKAVDPAADKVQVNGYRKTKDGGVLLRVKSGTGDRRTFQDKLRQVLGGDAQVRDMTSNVRLDILDLDCVTDIEEVTEALRQETGDTRDPKVHIFGPNKQGQCKAVCELEEGAANALLKKGRLKIGWVNCRVRLRTTVPRCYRCLGYGHIRTECNGPDRRLSCWKCGKTNHVGKDCKQDPTCFLCSEAGHEGTGHAPGTGACTVFRAALEECRRKTKT